MRLPVSTQPENERFPQSWRESALIIVGHGSTLNPDSSEPTHAHADSIRNCGLFAEVVTAFWKEEPSMREVLYSVESRRVYIVPLFISEGYFTLDVIPREFGLEGAVSRRDDREIRYCSPVGVHPSMTNLLVKRAAEVAPGVPREETTLLIVGHGTSLNDQSAQAIKDQVAFISERRDLGFAAVKATYMEEPPLISEWKELSETPNVVVVPFFIADGLHSYEDIPVMLGVEDEPVGAASKQDVFRKNPYRVGNRRLYYSSAIGTEPMMADVILDQVAAFDREHDSPHAAAPVPS
jgi:sirohydrochlorin cobaltochelatase